MRIDIRYGEGENAGAGIDGVVVPWSRTDTD